MKINNKEYTENTSFNLWSCLWLELKIETVCWVQYKSLESQVKHINRFIGQEPINNIYRFHVDKIINSLYKNNPNTNKPASKKYLKNIRNAISSIFELAIDNGADLNNPARGRRTPKSATVKNIRSLTEEEICLILNTEHKRCRVAALMMMFGGLRLGELICLRKNDIDFNSGVININKSVERIGTIYYIKNGTKNGKERKVPINRNILKEIKKELNNCSNELIVSKIDGEMHTMNSWRSSWKSYLFTLNLSLDINKDKNKYDPNGIVKNIKISPHMLRHTYATMLYDSNVDYISASLLMGHSDVKTTIDIYTHIEEAKRRNNLSIENLNELIESNYKKFIDKSYSIYSCS